MDEYDDELNEFKFDDVFSDEDDIFFAGATEIDEKAIEDMTMVMKNEMVRDLSNQLTNTNMLSSTSSVVVTTKIPYSTGLPTTSSMVGFSVLDWYAT